MKTFKFFKLGITFLLNTLFFEVKDVTICFILSFVFMISFTKADSINLSDLSNIKTYEQSDYNTFLNKNREITEK